VIQPDQPGTGTLSRPENEKSAIACLFVTWKLVLEHPGRER
jgi:hypothetical protein